MGKASSLSLLLAAGIAALTACAPAARPSAAPADPAHGGGVKPPSEAPPTPQPAEKSWTIGAADFGDGANLLSATSNRSAPYAWERITGGAADVRVSIGGRELPFKNTRTNPVFASDISGAEWEVAFEARAGALVLVLTAQDQSGAGDTVESVRITNPGNGYASVPTVTFSAPPPGGTTATGTAVGPDSVDSVTVGTVGSGYTSVPSVTFSAPSGGTTAAGTVGGSGYVDSVTVGSAGSGYTSVPTVTFGAAPSGGTTATGTAVRQSGVASVTMMNRGDFYTSDPSVTFSAAPSGGTTATGTAARRSEVGGVGSRTSEPATRLLQP